MNKGEMFTIDGKAYTVVDKSDRIKECDIEEVEKATQELINDVIDDFGTVENFVHAWLGGGSDD